MLYKRWGFKKLVAIIASGPSLAILFKKVRCELRKYEKYILLLDRFSNELKWFLTLEKKS